MSGPVPRSRSTREWRESTTRSVSWGSEGAGRSRSAERVVMSIRPARLSASVHLYGIETLPGSACRMSVRHSPARTGRPRSAKTTTSSSHWANQCDGLADGDSQVDLGDDRPSAAARASRLALIPNGAASPAPARRRRPPRAGGNPRTTFSQCQSATGGPAGLRGRVYRSLLVTHVVNDGRCPDDEFRRPCHHGAEPLEPVLEVVVDDLRAGGVESASARLVRAASRIPGVASSDDLAARR
ncbi:hypothetical protein HEB94_000279 [Actinopolymorpha pittospori]|uniref:Uncharacterized protein n=1 Tax=Actinopolymorpha pittospori TaxID=648752 RepID=A0A927MNE0_9ACTN|nr:hypothetical protein [Actinopolymorpha pittospori]